MNEVTVAEAARSLNLDESSVRKRIRQGRLEARRAGPRLWLIPEAELARSQALGKLKPGPRRRCRDGEQSPEAGDARSPSGSESTKAAGRGAHRMGTAASLLKHVGAWEGDDLPERLAEVYATRSRFRF